MEDEKNLNDVNEKIKLIVENCRNLNCIHESPRYKLGRMVNNENNRGVDIILILNELNPSFDTRTETETGGLYSRTGNNIKRFCENSLIKNYSIWLTNFSKCSCKNNCDRRKKYCCMDILKKEIEIVNPRIGIIFGKKVKNAVGLTGAIQHSKRHLLFNRIFFESYHPSLNYNFNDEKIRQLVNAIKQELESN